MAVKRPEITDATTAYAKGVVEGKILTGRIVYEYSPPNAGLRVLTQDELL